MASGPAIRSTLFVASVFWLVAGCTAPTDAGAFRTRLEAPTSTCRDQGGEPAQAALIARIVELTNRERQRAGLVPAALQCADLLQRVATSHSGDMARNRSFGHLDSRGMRPLDRVTAAEPSFAGMIAENVAMISVRGNRGPSITRSSLVGIDVNELADRFVRNWMRSKGHRENILHPRAREIGVGIAVTADAVYVTQLFSGPPRS